MDKGMEDLDLLLASLEPYLDGGKYIFHTVKQPDAGEMLTLDPIGFFKEKEGVSLIIREETARRNGIAYEGVFALISLQVHSSLQAVGLTAALATELAQQGISANVVAAYYHDHIFVPEHQAETALSAIKGLRPTNRP